MIRKPYTKSRISGRKKPQQVTSKKLADFKIKQNTLSVEEYKSAMLSFPVVFRAKKHDPL